MTFLYLNASTMGKGSDELGEKLLISFLRHLAESETPIDMVGCVNDGVMLTTRSGDALDALQKLVSKGATIASCGTCLDFHGIRGQLKIGVVGSMAETIEIMSTADRVIAPC